MSDDKILVNGQWIDKWSPEGYNYMVSIGMIKPYNDPNQPYTPPQQQPQQYVNQSTYASPPGYTPSAEVKAEMDKAENTQTPVSTQQEGDLEIVKAVQQEDGDIAYQVAANEQGRAAGLITTIDNIKNNQSLSNRQKQQIIAYVKAHPEQQFIRRTAEEDREREQKGIEYNTGPANSIMFADSQGISRPAVKDENGKYVYIDKRGDAIDEGMALNEQQARNQEQALRRSEPYIIPWLTGTAMGYDVNKVAVLEPDMTIYPVTSDVRSVYPQKIPLTMTEDPRNGLYAVGFEGTVQPNIFYDPSTKKFYGVYIDEPMKAIDVMSYTPLGMGGMSGVEVVAKQIKDTYNEPAITPYSGYRVTSQVTSVNDQLLNKSSPESTVAAADNLVTGTINSNSPVLGDRSDIPSFNEAVEYLRSTDLQAEKDALNQSIAAGTATEADYDRLNKKIDVYNQMVDIANQGPYVDVLREHGIDQKTLNTHNPVNDFLRGVEQYYVEGSKTVPTISGRPDWVTRDVAALPGTTAGFFANLGEGTQAVTEIALRNPATAAKVAGAGLVLWGGSVVTNAVNDPARTAYNIGIGSIAGGLAEGALARTAVTRTATGGSTVVRSTMDGFYNPASGKYDLTVRAADMTNPARVKPAKAMVSNEYGYNAPEISGVVGDAGNTLNMIVGEGATVGKTVINPGSGVSGTVVGVGASRDTGEIAGNHSGDGPEMGLPGQFVRRQTGQSESDLFLSRYGFRPGNAYNTRYNRNVLTGNSVRNRNVNDNPDLNDQMNLNKNMNLNDQMNLNRNLLVNPNLNDTINNNEHRHENRNETRNENRNLYVSPYGYGFGYRYENLTKFNFEMARPKPRKDKVVGRAKKEQYIYANDPDAILGFTGLVNGKKKRGKKGKGGLYL